MNERRRTLKCPFAEDSGASAIDVLAPTVQTNQIGDSEIESMVEERTAAKKARNFARADQIREQLLEQGIILEDTKSGVRWKRK